MKKFLRVLPAIFLVLYLMVPLLMMVIYSFVTTWTDTVIPKGFTMRWYVELYSDPNFIFAIFRTIFLASIAILFSLLLIVPTIFAVVMYFKKLIPILNILIIFCFAVPGVISVMSLTQAYDGLNMPKILLVVGSYIVSTIPIMTIGTANSLKNIRANLLVQSAEMLGASKWQAFREIILPNITFGILSSALFAFSGFFSEYAVVNLLLGGKFPTIQIYLRQKLTANGHYSSAIVVTYFILATIFTVVALLVIRKGEKNELSRN